MAIIHTVVRDGAIFPIIAVPVGPQGPPGEVDLTTAKGVVIHGSDPNAARPDGYLSVEWHGSVVPINAIDGDTRIVT